MKVLSLFDGISCGLQALKELNINVNKYYASEIDSDAINISNKNHPEIVRIGDVNNIDFNNYTNIDLLLGGSPCQGFSSQGKMLGFKDDRSFLFYKFVEALRTIKPKYFILENVKMKKEWISIIDKELGINGFLLSSKHFSAQDRKRFYWTNIQFDKYNLPDYNISYKDIEDKNANIFFTNDEIEKYKNGKWQTSKNYIKNCEKYKIDKFPTLWGKCYSLGNIPVVNIDGKYRLLSILELERLQTLPDGYTEVAGLTNRRRYITISNGWNVATIKHILKGIQNNNIINRGK